MVENKNVSTISEEILKFPTSFPLKVIGKNDDAFEQFVVRLVGKHVPYMDAGEVTTRESNGGKYLSVTITFIAQSRAQVDAIYVDLTQSGRVLFVI
jgi:uncharacterized protein